jgi:hypothetical protein
MVHPWRGRRSVKLSVFAQPFFCTNANRSGRNVGLIDASSSGTALKNHRCE